MDPVGMVKHYDDPVALSAAQAMRPQKYLVYLDYANLPNPSNPWFRYIVNPIGTTLRPEDSGRGITSDMVIPIYPNTFHPSGNRPPVRTYPPFPFSNCFHWIKSGVTVRVRRKATKYNDTNAYKITFQQRMQIDRTFLPDKMRINEFLRAKQEEAETSGGHSDRVSSISGGPPGEADQPDSDVESRIDDDLDSLPEGREISILRRWDRVAGPRGVVGVKRGVSSGAGPSGQDLCTDLLASGRTVVHSVTGAAHEDMLDGRLKVRGRVAEYLDPSQGRVLFEDGTQETGIDCAVLATGYQGQLPVPARRPHPPRRPAARPAAPSEALQLDVPRLPARAPHLPAGRRKHAARVDLRSTAVARGFVPGESGTVPLE
ncbi:hypothetical protein NUW54_g569 [Trametes sanguinea]|uniref:Uncharacterized protein n=1 Tax=Trametes sanguinea TaxID=158606 RepID=A0ACC1Q8T8_9APHY|nr:hypothetical protein NUW54_g569 [Trametes sanguinea]